MRNIILDDILKRIRNDETGGAFSTGKAVAVALGKLIQKEKDVKPDSFMNSIEKFMVEVLKESPTMATVKNFFNTIGIILEENSTSEVKEQAPVLIDKYLKDSNISLQDIAKTASRRLEDGDVVLLFSFSSTLIEVIKFAIKKKTKLKVIVCEGYPTNEGYGAIKFLEEYKVPYYFIPDIAAGYYLSGTSKVITGADCITCRGDVINKIGTSMVALDAYDKNIPFMVVASTQKFDPVSKFGFLPRVQRLKVKLGSVYENKEDRLTISLPLFDVTPGRNISEIITEAGIMNPFATHKITDRLKISSIFVKCQEKAYRELEDQISKEVLFK